MRQFRATSLGEFAVALFIFAAIGALFLGLVLCAMPSPAQAVDWVGGSNDWNTPANWEPADVPASLGETATFNALGSTTPTLSGTVTIASITFNPGANAYTIENPNNQTFQLLGAGIINNSVFEQTINSSNLQFLGNSTAGNTTINNSFTLTFAGNSTAGNTTIINSSILGFLGDSTAGNGRSSTRLICFFLATQAGGTRRSTTRFIGFFWQLKRGQRDDQQFDRRGEHWTDYFPRHVNCRERANQQRRRRNHFCWECDDYQQWSRKLYVVRRAYP